MEESRMAAEANVNYWAVSFTALTRFLRGILESDSAKVSPTNREEARRILGAWEESLALDPESPTDGVRRAQSLSALRKRTIEILIRHDRALER
jgi:hypothetical protein